MAAQVLPTETTLGGKEGDFLSGMEFQIAGVIGDGKYAWRRYFPPISDSSDLTKDPGSLIVKSNIDKAVDAKLKAYEDDAWFPLPGDPRITTLTERDALNGKVKVGDRCTVGPDDDNWTRYVVRSTNPVVWDVETTSAIQKQAIPIIKFTDIVAGVSKDGKLVTAEEMNKLLIGPIVNKVSELPDPTKLKVGYPTYVAEDRWTWKVFGTDKDSFGTGWLRDA